MEVPLDLLVRHSFVIAVSIGIGASNVIKDDAVFDSLEVEWVAEHGVLLEHVEDDLESAFDRSVQ